MNVEQLYSAMPAEELCFEIFMNYDLVHNSEVKLRLKELIDREFENGVTLLHELCAAGHYDGVKLLLENGADPNQCSSGEQMDAMLWLYENSSGACISTSESRKKIAELLINAGADIFGPSKCTHPMINGKSIYEVYTKDREFFDVVTFCNVIKEPDTD